MNKDEYDIFLENKRAKAKMLRQKKKKKEALEGSNCVPGGQRLRTGKSLVREIYLSASPFLTPTTWSFVLSFPLIYMYFLMDGNPQILILQPGSWPGQLVIN